MQGQKWEDYEAAADHGPMRIGLKTIFLFLMLGIVVAAIGYPLGWFGEAARVAQDEFGPKAALAKYEWFKTAAAELDKKQADIKVYAGRMKALEEAYAGKSRSEWPREDREQWNVWSSEVAGVKASYNSLAAEYNAAMAKWNWRFTETGNLPAGAKEPLPREFKPYEDK